MEYEVEDGTLLTEGQSRYSDKSEKSKALNFIEVSVLFGIFAIILVFFIIATIILLFFDFGSIAV